MDLSIKDCPACGAVLIGDSTQCPMCGEMLAAEEVPEDPLAGVPRLPTHNNSPAGSDENICPKCGARVPKLVIRCRDCGAFMQPEVEEALRAKQSSLVTDRTWTRAVDEGDAQAAGATPLEAATDLEAGRLADVAEDNDFDFRSDVELVDTLRAAGSGEDFEFDGPVDSGQNTEGYAMQPDDSALPDSSPETPAEANDATPAAIEPGQAAAPAAAAPRVETEAPSGPVVSHSEVTGGDALLNVALQEQAEAAQRAKQMKRRRATASPGETFVVFCPRGHRVLVSEKHRGRMGRCPNCKSPFFVPPAPQVAETGVTGAASEAAAGAAAPAPPAESGYRRWLRDVHLHRVNPLKLKLKPDSLLNEYDTADIGLGAGHLLLAVVFSGGGAFRARAEPKKKPATRQALLDHLLAKGPIDKLPVDRHSELAEQQAGLVKIVQPAVPGEETLFAGVPVFGAGRIAVRFPATSEGTERWYASFSLSQFREFSQMLAELFGVQDFGSAVGVPLDNSFTEATCHYSDSKLRAIDKLDWYRADPAFQLDLIGWKCATCGLVVSEDSRKKEKIGGKSPSSVPKARCPKCKNRFGDKPLYGLKAAPPTS